MSKRTSGRHRQSRRPVLPSSTAPLHPEDPACVFPQDRLVILRHRELFQPGNETLCARLLQELARQDEIESARASLANGTCEIVLAQSHVDHASLANRIATAIHTAAAPSDSDSTPKSCPGAWQSLSAFRVNQAVSFWQTLRETPGRLHLRNRLLRTDATRATAVAHQLASLPGVQSCRSTFWAHDVEIHFDPTSTDAHSLTRAAATAFEQALASKEPNLPAVSDPNNPPVARGLTRAWYFSLATGSFLLTIVGIILPIVPTIPFLMATSYYLVRASPTLNRRLLRSHFFGPILEDLQTSGGLRPTSKIKLIAFALSVGVVTVIVIGPPALVLLIMAAVYSVTIYWIARMPGVPTDSQLASKRSRHTSYAVTAR